MSKKNKATKTGMSRAAEIGAMDCLTSESGRAFIAYILEAGCFHDVVPDSQHLIAQGVAMDLYEALSILDRGNTLKLYDDYFLGGGRINEHGRDERDDDGDGTGDTDGND